MDETTVAFGLPLLGMFVGLAVLVIGIFQGGLTPTALVGIAISFVSVTALALAVNATPTR
ncbi:hypothetical protein [Natronobiforma cellulositropha]|uniref:hypothetical protein n=1 Tax=Natronobiforma cellulositropha TaxID=1679076 RepID=UPI0021D584AE|nr:hypothetical protein [Natronobiforma cellulositropha]